MFQPRSQASSPFLPFTAWEGGCDCLQIDVTLKYDATMDDVTKNRFMKFLISSSNYTKIKEKFFCYKLYKI